VIGLEEVDHQKDTVFLRAWGDWEHHTLALTAGEDSSIGHIGWRAKHREDVEEFARRLSAAGTAVERVAAGQEKGQGESIRFQLASGHPFEIYFDVERPLAPPERRSRLKNQPFRGFERGVSPRRLDHVNVAAGDPIAMQRWLMDHMGFKMREYVQLDNGFIPAAWMSVTPLVHDIAVLYEAQNRPARLHHVAYYTDNWQDLLRAADILRDQGITINLGPGKHGISQAFFLYVKDPGSGHRLELFSGGYLIFDSDWEPIVWSEAELAEGIIWWGAPLPADFMGDTTGTSKVPVQPAAQAAAPVEAVPR
jgi:catechol 2,3-dioxygenase